MLLMRSFSLQHTYELFLAGQHFVWPDWQAFFIALIISLVLKKIGF